MAANDSIPEIRDIPGYPGYGASADGRIWSRHERRKMPGCVQGPNWMPGETWHQLRGSREGDGYVTVCPMRGGRKGTAPIHTLVLLAFAGPRPAGMQCRHLNGDRTDNRLANLMWGTAKENAADRAAHRGGGRPRRKGASALDAGKVRQIRELVAAGRTRAEVARRFGLDRGTVRRILHGKTWKHLN
jgi:hypothetical protein